MRVLGRAEEAIRRLAEAVGYYCPPGLVLEAEKWLDDLREALREGAAASSALEAALARERRLAQEVERLRGAFYRAMTALKEAV
ncbi:hypothetical protein [Thermus brockianus]|uniref:Uncharacterized protein n=1 Tax=Thermus brockianus TaxID=56956 RepID=A0ABM7XKW6_THEBO|nr:hypothetical protein [Thermus brockianus]BDG16969.1 hypothetical protein TbrSNM41_17030 [Thermus brockianus]